MVETSITTVIIGITIQSAEAHKIITNIISSLYIIIQYKRTKSGVGIIYYDISTS